MSFRSLVEDRWNRVEKEVSPDGSMKITFEDGDIHYLDAHGEFHRTDGPAVISDGYKAWMVHGVLHRIDGPARMWLDNKNHYYVYGKRLSREEYRKHFDDVTEKK